MREEIDGMARDNATWLQRQRPPRAHRDDQSPLQRLHDGHAIGHADADDDADDIAKRAVALLGKTEAGARAVRLLGAGVHNIVGRDDDDENEEELRLF